MNITYLVDRLADVSPEAPAMLSDTAPPVPWAAFRDRVARLAGALRDQGVEAGDRVALLCRNRAEFLEVVLGCAWIGAIVVPLNYRLASAEIAFQLEDSGAGLLFVEDACADIAAGANPDLKHIAIGAPDSPYEDLIARAAPLAEAADLPGDHTLGIFYTGGTTGVPKGVMLTHQNLLSNASHVVRYQGYTPADVHLHAAPMFHLADLGGTFGHLFGGGAHVFLPQFTPAGFFAAMARHGGTTVLLAPTMVDRLTREPPDPSLDLSAWRQLCYGGSPITEATLRRAFDLLPCSLLQGFGQTEATQTVCIMSSEDHRRALDEPRLLRTCGRPVAGIHARIVDEDLNPLPAGEVGEVVIRGPTVMKGYWNRPEETQAALRGGWLHMGDLGSRDAEGFITLVDRKKDVIVSGGENVFSPEVENALAAHPDVVECAVIAVPDERWGERVHAVVVLAEGSAADRAALEAHCRTLIGGYKVPRSFDFLDALPKTAYGKIQKSALRDRYWTGVGRGVA